jgi:hypothetical protein
MASSALMTVMINAARKAARGVQRDFGEIENLQVSRKGPGDFVTNADQRTEKNQHRSTNDVITTDVAKWMSKFASGQSKSLRNAR